MVYTRAVPRTPLVYSPHLPCRLMSNQYEQASPKALEVIRLTYFIHAHAVCAVENNKVMKISANVVSTTKLAGSIARNATAVQKFIAGDFGTPLNSLEFQRLIKSGHAASIDPKGYTDLLSKVFNAPFEAVRFDKDGKERTIKEQREILLQYAAQQKVARLMKLATAKEQVLITDALPKYMVYLESHISAILAGREWASPKKKETTEKVEA